MKAFNEFDPMSLESVITICSNMYSFRFWSRFLFDFQPLKDYEHSVRFQVRIFTVVESLQTFQQIFNSHQIHTFSEIRWTWSFQKSDFVCLLSKEKLVGKYIHKDVHERFAWIRFDQEISIWNCSRRTVVFNGANRR